MDEASEKAPGMTWQECALLLDECDYLFAIDVREVTELSLKLTIAEAKAQAFLKEVDQDDPVEALLAGSRPIAQDDTCKMFEVTFAARHMVCYMISNETYGRYPEAPEVFEGKLFRSFSQSHLLTFVRQTTNAEIINSEALLHFQIACLNHIVDVICTAPPEIVFHHPLAETHTIR